jgi:sugar/nucleoside kinase (ribokinase family)
MSPAESNSVVVVGSINEDVVLHLGRNIQPGETVTAERIERLPGGEGRRHDRSR